MADAVAQGGQEQPDQTTEEKPAQKPEKTKFRVTQLFEKSAAAPAVCTAFLGITVCSVTNFIASYGKTILVNNTGFFFIVNGLMTLAVFPALKKFSQRKYNNRVFVLGVAAFLVSLGCLLVTRGAPLIAVSAGFYSVGYAACQPILNALPCPKRPRNEKGPPTPPAISPGISVLASVPLCWECWPPASDMAASFWWRWRAPWSWRESTACIRKGNRITNSFMAI